MQESLVCSVCEKTWKRNKTRGRKPTVCPKCLKSVIQDSQSKPKQPNQKSEAKKSDPVKPTEVTVKKNSSDVTPQKVYQSLYPKDPSFEELRESTKNGSVWKCTACGNIMQLTLAITAVPTHKCSPTSSKINLYERIG